MDEDWVNVREFDHNNNNNNTAPMSGAPSSKLQISVSCSNLENKDLMSKSDPQLFVYLQRNNSPWNFIGKSEVVWDNLNPKFSKLFEIEYLFEELQNLRFIIVDVDSGNGDGKLEDQEFLGKIEVTVAKICASRNQTIELDLLTQDNRKGKGKIKISAEETQDNNDEIEFSFIGHNLDKKDFFFSADPYLQILRSRENGEWAVVYRTEIIKNNLNPIWKPFTLKMKELNNLDMERTLMFQVMNWSRFGSHELIGQTTISTTELIASRGNSLELINDAIRKKKHHYKNSGSIKILEARIFQKPTFLQYVTAGLDINLAIAIDFTQSNGDPRDSNSLHHIRQNYQNPYQAAISSVGTILQEYDSDKKFPVFGFGAKFPDGNISHCFPLNGNPNDPEIVGIDGILQYYQSAIRSLQLWGPTNFTPVIRATQSVIEATQRMGLLKYFILLIVTDGVITDMDSTIRAIVELSYLPASIVIVGVGNADFTNMNILDGDEVPLQANGRQCQRDIVQFVPFSQIRDPYQLAKETLAEIPGQVVDYMTFNRILPQHISNPA